MSDSKDLNDFVEKVTKDTPRLVINYRKAGDRDEFDWGVTSGVPVLALVGAIIRAQAEISQYFDSSVYPNIHSCPEPCMVIAYDAPTNEFKFYLNDDIPVDTLLATLETVKIAAISMHMANERRSAQPVGSVLGLDGKPFRG